MPGLKSPRKNQQGNISGRFAVSTSEKIAVIGDGAMGSVCSIILANKGYDVGLWGAFADNVKDMVRQGENRKYLPGFRLPEQLRVSSKAGEILAGADLLISAVPCQYMR